MNFLGVGTGELVIVLVIAMLVVGPERMVVLAGQFGRWLAKTRRMLDEATEEFRDATKEVREAFALEAGEGGEQQAAPTAAAASGETALTGAALALAEGAEAPAGSATVEAPEPTPEAVAAFEAQQLEMQLAVSLVDGEIGVEPGVLAGSTTEAMDLEEDPGSRVEPVAVSVAELVPEDVDVTPVVMEEVVLVADEAVATAAAGEGPRPIAAAEPAIIAESAAAETIQAPMARESEG